MRSRKETSLGPKDFNVPRILRANHYPPPYIHPILRLAIYLVITIAIGNAFMGWAGVQELLYKAGTFESLCNESNSTTIQIRSSFFIDCPARKEAIKGLFTIAFSTNIFCCIFSGFILDFFGQKFTFVFGNLANLACWIALGLNPTNGTLVRIVFFFMGLTAECLYLPLTTASLYFPKSKGLVLSILGAARTISFTVPSFLSYLFLSPKMEAESFYIIAIGFALVGYLGSGVVGFFVIQKNFFDKSHITFENIENHSDKDEKVIRTVSVSSIKFIDSLHSLADRNGIWETLIFCLSAALYMATVQMVNKTHREIFVTTKGDSAIEYFRYGQILSFVPELALGLLIDIIGSAFSFLIMQLFLLASVVIFGFDFFPAKLTGCFLYTVGASLFLSIIIFYVYENYPPERLGVTLGFVLLFCGTAVVLNIPVYRMVVRDWNKGGRYLNVSLILMVYVLVSIAANLILVYVRTRRKRLTRKRSGACAK